MHGFVQTGIFAFVFTRPHPVGTQRNGIHAAFQRCPHNIGKCFADRHDRTMFRIDQCDSGSMSQRSGNTFLPLIVNGNGSQVTQWQLQGAATLLAGDFSRYRTVHFVGQPVFAADSFQTKYIGDILFQVVYGSIHCLIMFFYGFICDDSFWRIAEHIVECQIDRSGFGRCLLKDKGMVVGGFTHYIHRSPFPIGNAVQTSNILFFHQQSHSFLRFIADDFLGRQGLVADWQFVHIDFSACLLQ